MPKIVDEAAQRRRIREAARRVFSKRGIATTGLVHVAAEASMRRSSLYHYYPDKAAIVRDLARDLLAEEETLFDSALVEEGSALERIEGLASAVASLFDLRASTGRMILELWASEPDAMRATLRSVRRSLADLIRQGQQRGELSADLEADHVATLLVALMDGVMIQIFLDPGEVGAGPEFERSFSRAVRRMLAD